MQAQRIESHNDFNKIFKTVKDNGNFLAPRGEEIIEIENYAVELAPYIRFCNYPVRKLNINYIKAEFLWYLTGDAHNLAITEFAKTWETLVKPDKTINSNYGQYIFAQGTGFDRVVETLKNDKDSRRATIMILSNEHLNSVCNDYPCTYAINFRIRENKLNMSVNMRSQDAIFGFGNDIPCFSFMHEMMYMTLKQFYPELQYGTFYNSANSFHVYKRHFEMLDTLAVSEDNVEVDCPQISSVAEVEFLRKLNFTNIPEEYKFTKWLTTFDEVKYAKALETIVKTPSQLSIFDLM